MTPPGRARQARRASRGTGATRLALPLYQKRQGWYTLRGKGALFAGHIEWLAARDDLLAVAARQLRQTTKPS